VIQDYYPSNLINFAPKNILQYKYKQNVFVSNALLQDWASNLILN